VRLPRSVLLALGLVAGCLEVPSGPGQECRISADCDPGEVCSEGLCYGNPPTGMFAATLTAPSAREDLVATELVTFMLPEDGALGDLQLETPVTISGRVEAYCSSSQPACSTLSVAAQVRVTRPSRFPGGPTLRFSTQSKADVPRGSDSFVLRVPRTRPGDEPWSVTIDPEGGSDEPPAHGGTDPAEVVPPKRFTLHAADNVEHQTYTLGSPDAAVITGTLKDAIGQPLLGYRVVAMGRWDMLSAPTEVSTVHFSDDGSYTLVLSDNIVGAVEVVARPFARNVVAPSLHVTGVAPITQQRNITQPSGLGERASVTVPVQGLAGNGEVRPISGVRVIVRAAIEPTFSGGARAVLVAEATTGEDGIARLALLDGTMITNLYRLRVVPPASSSFGVVYDRTIELGEIATAMETRVLAPVRLPSRVAVRGTVVDVHGQPLPSVSVTARRAQRFLWSLSAPNQAFLDEIPAATAITQESGEFIVWVDPAVADVWGHYDLYFETPAGSRAPNWTIPDLEIPRIAGQQTVSLETIAIPDAARIRGRIVDSSGNKVEGSALRVFQLASDDHVCRDVGYAPEGCTPASVVLGYGESDRTGTVRLTLPRDLAPAPAN
jgi:hypothetical protein